MDGPTPRSALSAPEIASREPRESSSASLSSMRASSRRRRFRRRWLRNNLHDAKLPAERKRQSVRDLEDRKSFIEFDFEEPPWGTMCYLARRRPEGANHEGGHVAGYVFQPRSTLSWLRRSKIQTTRRRVREL